ncbi:MAG: sugar ABC transporter substrate-binding protein [Butyricicoccus sp.]
MTTKKIAAIVCAAAMTVSMTGCFGSGGQQSGGGSAASGSAGGASDSKLVIGMTVNNAGADPYQTAYYSAAESYAKELGIELKLLDPVGDVTKQQNQVQDLIGMNCDAIVVWPCNSEAAVAMVKSINKAGIPVMSANTNVVESGKEYLECYVGPSNILEGKQTAEQMVADIGNDAKILYIDGPAGYSTSAERRQGMDEGIAGTNIEVLESQIGEGNREKSQQVMENYLVKYPEGSVDAVFCMDDNTAIGAINAMEAAGRTDIKVYAAACGDYNTLTYIKEGKLRATAMQSPIIDAQTALDYAVRIAKGEKMAEFDNFMETPVATADNIDSLNIEPW